MNAEEYDEMLMSWYDYRKDYDAEDNVHTRKAFQAGWEAARGQLDAGGPLR